MLLSPVVVRGRRCLRQPEPVCAGVMLADHWPGALSGTAAAAAPRRGVDVGAMDNGGGGGGAGAPPRGGGPRATRHMGPFAGNTLLSAA
eukprot:COSAG01_NODE_11033_length_2023_cov_9.512474_2_plen_88_part_01